MHLKLNSNGEGKMENQLRRVSISGHQEFWKGWFHLFTVEGKAIIEADDGQIHLVDAHKVRFISLKE